MPELSILQRDHSGESGGGCDSGGCGNGLEKIYPTLGVRYGAMNWVGEFEYKPKQVFRCGGKIVVQTDRGIELGEQVSLTCNGCEKSVSREQIKTYIESSGPEFYRLRNGRVLREATEEDIVEHERLNAHVKDDVDRCALMAAQLMLDMKIVTAEHLLGGERVVFYFRAEQRVDFRELVRELARHYQTRIELRQVGARDEARLVADYEICGRECCCKNFLKKLRPVSMKMAKLQKSTLDPSKVSGRCGRLRCCLRYEHEGYEELNKKLIRVNKRVESEHGLGVVVDRQVLTQLLLVRLDDGTDMTIPNEEVQLSDAPMPPPAEEGDDDNNNGRTRRSPRGRRDRDQSGGDGAASSQSASQQGADAPSTDAERTNANRDAADEADNAGGRPPRRKRRRPRGRSDAGDAAQQQDTTSASDGGADRSSDGDRGDSGRSASSGRGPRKRRRRRGRGGRRRPDGPADGGSGSE